MQNSIIQNQSINSCDNLLGLYSRYDPDDLDYVYAFSFDKQILLNMIRNNVPEEEKKYYSIKPIKIYKQAVIFREEDNKPCEIIFNISNNSNMIYDEKLFPIYGFNLIGNNNTTCDQVLLSTKNKNQYLVNEGISHNPIEIDTFYEESIVNA